MVTKSYTEARAHLAELLDLVTTNREPVLITRRGAETVAVIAADELDSLLETVHLLRSRTNAERLLTALARAKAREESPSTLDDLKAEFGLDDAGQA
jgi:antitoxin YefM